MVKIRGLGLRDPGSNPGVPIYKMKKSEAALVLFHDSKGKILLQDRRKISKWGEEFGFFGGHIEKGETPEQALIREIEEEMGFRLNKFRLFRKDDHISFKLNEHYKRHIFLAPIPKGKVNVSDGKAALMDFKESFYPRMIPGHTDLLKDIFRFLKTKDKI